MASEIPELMVKGRGENNFFFYHSVTHNRVQNKIFVVNNAMVDRLETRKEIKASINIYFLDILRDPRKDRRQDIEKITRLIPYLVSNDQNELLMKPITLNEVEE